MSRLVQVLDGHSGLIEEFTAVANETAISASLSLRGDARPVRPGEAAVKKASGPAGSGVVAVLPPMSEYVHSSLPVAGS
jgi:hypothetical protein